MQYNFSLITGNTSPITVDRGLKKRFNNAGAILVEVKFLVYRPTSSDLCFRFGAPRHKNMKDLTDWSLTVHLLSSGKKGVPN